MPRRGLEIVPVAPCQAIARQGIPEVVIGAIDRDMSRSTALMHQTHGCSHKTQAFSPKFLSNSRKQRFLAGSSRHAHMPTPQPASSPPRLPCRSPGPGPSVASPSCPKPHLSRVSKLTPAHNTPHEAISCLFYPQTAPARTPTSHMIKHSPPSKHSPAQNEDGCFHRVPTHTLTLTFASVGSHVPSSKPR